MFPREQQKKTLQNEVIQTSCHLPIHEFFLLDVLSWIHGSYDKMRLPLGGSLVAPHASAFPAFSTAIHPPLSWVPPKPLSTPKLNRRLSPCRFDRQVRRLHPVDSALEGVPSSLFTFRPGSPRHPPPEQSNGDVDGADVHAVPLQAGLIEEADLAGVSALLVEVR